MFSTNVPVFVPSLSLKYKTPKILIYFLYIIYIFIKLQFPANQRKRADTGTFVINP